MKRPKRDPERENRIHNEAIVDAGPEEQAMSFGRQGVPVTSEVSGREGYLAAQER